MADVIVENEGQVDKAISDIGLTPKRRIIFVAPSMYEGFVTQLEDSVANRLIMVIHNGDIIDEACIKKNAEKFLHTFCVNWLGLHDKVTAIPIGLENASKDFNGRLSHFADALPSSRPRLLEQERPFNVLVSFSIQNSPSVREKAFQDFQGLQNSAIFRNPIGVSRYHSLLRRSLFTISPPGNGFDCHRTWEAMYCGSVPVVLRDYWPFNKKSYPALIVDNWCEARELINSNPLRLYQDAIEKGRTGPYANSLLEELERWRNG